MATGDMVDFLPEGASAMLMTAAWQNQVAGTTTAETTSRLPTWPNLVGMGYVLTMIAVFTTEYSERGAMHGPLFYMIAAVAYPAVLVASVRATACIASSASRSRPIVSAAWASRSCARTHCA